MNPVRVIRSSYRRTLNWYYARPLLLILSLFLLSLLAGKLVDISVRDIATALRISEGGVVTAGLALALGIGVASWLLHVRHRADPTPSPYLDKIVTRLVFKPSDLEKLRRGLIARLYEGEAPPSDEVMRMYAANPRIGVALFDPDMNDFVGFAAAWPLTDAAAEALKAGTLTENDLKASDILPATQNDAANFVIVPAFGVDAHARALLGLRLYHELRALIRRNYLRRDDRVITLLATGFSEDGCRWCTERLHMTQTSYVEMHGKQLPVFSRTISGAEFDSL